jgi:hypothetical protein
VAAAARRHDHRKRNERTARDFVSVSGKLHTLEGDHWTSKPEGVS